MHRNSITTKAISRIVYAFCLTMLIIGCSSGDSGAVSEQQFLGRLTQLKSEILRTTPVAIQDWNCDLADPRFSGADTLKRLSAIGSNCIWSTNPDVIEVDLFCGATAKRPCETILGDISRTTGVFESVDLSKMLVTRMLDGIQKSQNGFTSWTVTDRGIHLIIDARRFLESEASK